MTVKVFTSEYLDDLTLQARVSPRRRQHRNVHEDFTEACQRTFNAIEPDSYLPPHRHDASQGPETMIAVRGLMALVVFDDSGEILQVQPFGAGGDITDSHIAVGTETPPGIWHSVVSMGPSSVLLEVKAGPYNPNAPRYLAPWAPEEGSPEGLIYLANLVAAIKGLPKVPGSFR